MDRVTIFIDGSNFYHALKDAGLPVNVDFGKLGSRLTGDDRRHVHTYYYNAPLIRPRRDDPDFGEKDKRCRSQQRFFNALRFIPNLTFKRGWLRHLPDGGQIEKGVDVMLATDLLYFAWNDFYDVAVLVSGDSDFAYALQAVKNMGKHTEVAYFESGVSKDLLNVADNRHLLNRSFFRGLWVGKHRSKRRTVSKEG